MTKRLLLAAAVFGFLSVALGAMGAHKLKEIISPADLAIFEKGVLYQFFHTLAIMAMALLLHRFNQRYFYYAGIAFCAGIVCFSGSLYLLALRDVLGISTTAIGPVTPIGGLFFLAGWLLMLIAILKTDFKKS